MEHHHTISIHIQYWEGGNSYRPIVLLPAPPKWPSPKIAYYKSSGSSNVDEFNVYRTDTWFPTLGLLEAGTTLYKELREHPTDPEEDVSIYTDGYILKRNVFASLFGIELSAWYKTFLAGNELFSLQRQYKIYGALTQLFITDQEKTLTKEEEDDIRKQHKKITDAASVLHMY